ncbi:MAG TPA: 5-formyltetrahydrofolate cyclo-ligase [Rhizomicrobium sp.]|jgi:5-formyltetrahydrofolate cyclo-ligase
MSEDSTPEPADLRAWRNSERARLLDIRRNMPAAEHRNAGEMIARTLNAFLPPGTQELLGCYWPFRREFNCVPYMREQVRAGGGVALPVVRGRGQPLEFRHWTEEAVMEKGVWDIPHPAEGPPVIPTALLISLVGFDEAGFRLGYGAAYYDMTLAALPSRTLAIGIGFEYSRLPSIHPQPHDRRMDAIITEAGLRQGWARER